MSKCKISLLIIGCFSLSLSAFGQGRTVAKVAGEGLLKSGTEIAAESGAKEWVQQGTSAAWRKNLAKEAQLYYMLPNNSLREEIAKGENRSEVGTPDFLKYHKWRDRAAFFGDDEVKNRIAALMAKTEKQYADFPAYNRSFPEMWKNLPENERSLNMYEVVLEGAYGLNQLFEGRFITQLNDVFALANQPVLNPVDAHTALENALAQAFQKKDGFLVILVNGNERRPKDVLLIDLPSKQFISLRKTQKSLWSQRSALERSTSPQELDGFVDYHGKRSPVLDNRATCGVMLGVNYVPERVKDLSLPIRRITKDNMQPAGALDERYTVMLSHNGEQWAVFSMKSPEGNQIFQAFSQGYYIYFEPKDVPPNAASPWEVTADGKLFFESHDYILSFAEKKGAQLFATLEELRSHLVLTKKSKAH